jgi:hypothetical protein
MSIYTNTYLRQIQSIALLNKYTNWYCAIIFRAQNRATTRKEAKILLGYVEKHHILPESFNLGGENDKENYAYLSLKEHFICHRLLCKMIDSVELNRKCKYAVAAFMRSTKHQTRILTSRQYESARKMNSEARTGQPTNRKGCKFSTGWRENISKSKKGIKPLNFQQWVTSSKGKSYYNNSINEKRFHPTEVPAGWFTGRLQIQCNCGKFCDIANLKKYHKSCGNFSQGM